MLEACLDLGWMDDSTSASGAARWRHHLVDNTAWRRYARLRVLWRDVDHLVTRRDEGLWRGAGIPQTPAAKEDLDVIWATVTSNGHLNMPLGVTDITVVTHESQLFPLFGEVEIYG